MKVAVVGLGLTGYVAVRTLLDAGVTDLALRDGVDGRPPGALEWLQATYPAATFTEIPTDLTDPGWLADRDVCLLAADTIDATECLAINALCVAERCALVPGLGMGEVAQVGPVLRGGAGPCLHCIDVRTQTASGRTALAGPFTPDHELAGQVGAKIASLALDYLRDNHGAEPLPAPTTYLWSDGRTSEHHALRFPDCPTCRSCEPTVSFARPASLDLAGGPMPDADRIFDLEALIHDPIMGVVRWTTTYEPTPTEPAVAHAVASVADPAWIGTGQEIHGGGNDLAAEGARAAALGEALDRIATSQPSPDWFLVAPFADVARDAIDPTRFDYFDEPTRQKPDFPFTRVETTTPLSWIWGWSVGGERPVLVPASRVFVPLAPQAPGDLADGSNVSGCATGSSPADAALGGLLEVLERDAFTIAWANRLSLTGLVLDRGSPGQVGAYYDAFDAVGIEVRCSTITLDWGVPLVVAIARSPHTGDPASVVAAAADADLAVATRRALKELTANLAFTRTLIAQHPEPQSSDPASVRSQDAHALLFAQPSMTHHLDDWWAPAEMIGVPEPRSQDPLDSLATVSGAVISSGSDVVVVDLTLPGLAERGLFTYKVIVPEAYPMNFDSAWPHLGGDRLRNAPVLAGHVDRPLDLDQLNPTPHPFP